MTNIADADLHCLQRQGVSGLSRTSVRKCWISCKQSRPDQMLCSVTSSLGLHCLLRPVSQILRVVVYISRKGYQDKLYFSS